MARYGQKIKWTHFDGSTEEVDIGDCDTPEEARREAVRFAQQCGWTRPRWWQWWRRRDTRPAEDEATDFS